jgi:hypothetical protein
MYNPYKDKPPEPQKCICGKMHLWGGLCAECDIVYRMCLRDPETVKKLLRLAKKLGVEPPQANTDGTAKMPHAKKGLPVR